MMTDVNVTVKAECDKSGLYRCNFADTLSLPNDCKVAITSVTLFNDKPTFEGDFQVLTLDVAGYISPIRVQNKKYEDVSDLIDSINDSILKKHQPSESEMQTYMNSLDTEEQVKIGTWLNEVNNRNATEGRNDNVPNYNKMVSLSLDRKGHTKVVRKNQHIRSIWISFEMREALGLSFDMKFRPKNTIYGTRMAILPQLDSIHIESRMVEVSHVNGSLRPLLHIINLPEDSDDKIIETVVRPQYIKVVRNELDYFEWNLKDQDDKHIKTITPVTITLHFTNRLVFSA
jgi:hypothetical protein